MTCRKGLSCDPKNGNTAFKQCVIVSASYSGATFGDPVHFAITYNDRHDPVSATPDLIGTGSPQRVFYYDSTGRLISYAGIYTNGWFDTCITSSTMASAGSSGIRPTYSFRSVTWGLLRIGDSLL